MGLTSEGSMPHRLYRVRVNMGRLRERLGGGASLNDERSGYLYLHYLGLREEPDGGWIGPGNVIDELRPDEVIKRESVEQPA
jgi:hypothetical protein